MNRIRALSAILVLCMILSCAVFSGCSYKSPEIYSNNGELIARLDSSDIYSQKDIDSIYLSYIEMAFNEATNTLMYLNDIPQEEAQDMLLSSGYRIDTYLDTDIAAIIDDVYAHSEASPDSFGCALTNMSGCVLALYSNENEDNVNYATQRQYPYSTLKPLSVYAQAVDRGIINWSSMYKDSPYKQIENEYGETEDWPQNAMGTYENKKVTVYKGLYESLNTIAVKVIDDVGVTDSISFLRQNFYMPLDYELEKALSQGEEEVIGNVAMGYINAGISPVEMAGYYRVFADGGKYSIPTTIKKITAPDGSVVFEHIEEPAQVFSEETAYIMNRMMCGVVKPGGTGFDAGITGAEVSGKTGTGTNNDGHWFVGVVPQYSCAVWHGGISEDNYSPEIFSDIVSQLRLDENADYPYCDTVVQKLYCEESGLLALPGCSQVNIGYYCVDDAVASCTIHK